MSKLSKARVILLPFAARGEISALPAKERDSDCWPDWSEEHPDPETRAFAAANTPSIVMRELFRTAAYFVVLIGVIATLVLA